MASSISGRQPDEDNVQRKEVARKRDQPWLISLQAGMQPPGRYSISNHYGLRPEREGLHLVLQLRHKSIENIANDCGIYSFNIFQAEKILRTVINCYSAAEKRILNWENIINSGMDTQIYSNDVSSNDITLLKLPIPLMGLFLENSIKTGSQIQIQAV